MLAKAAPSNWLGRPFARALDGHACHNFFHGNCLHFPKLWLSSPLQLAGSCIGWLFGNASKGGISPNLVTI